MNLFYKDIAEQTKYNLLPLKEYTLRDFRKEYYDLLILKYPNLECREYERAVIVGLREYGVNPRAFKDYLDNRLVSRGKKIKMDYAGRKHNAKPKKKSWWKRLSPEEQRAYIENKMQCRYTERFIKNL